MLTYYEVINVLNVSAAVTRVIEPRVEQDVDGDPHAKGALQTLPEMPLKHVCPQTRRRLQQTQHIESTLSRMKSRTDFQKFKM